MTESANSVKSEPQEPDLRLREPSAKRQSCRRPKHSPKAQCWDALAKQGWVVQRRGFPTFMAFKDGTVAFVEAHGTRSERQRRIQHDLFVALTKASVQCYSWAASTGFVRFRIPKE